MVPVWGFGIWLTGELFYGQPLPYRIYRSASAMLNWRNWLSLDGSKLHSTLLLLAALSLMINIIGLAVPLALLQVYNRIIPNQGETTLTILVVGVLGALLLEAVLRWFRSYYTGWIGARYEHVTGCEIFRRLLFASGKGQPKEAGSELQERMSAIQTVGELYSGQLFLALFDLPFLVLYLMLLLQLGGELAVIPICSIVLVTAISYRLGMQMGKALDDDSKSVMRRFGFINETLARVHTVKAMAMESLMLRRYELLQNSHAQKTREIIFRGVVLPTFSSFMAQANTALVVTFGAIAVMDGDLTTGGLAACTMLSGRMFQPLQTLVGGWTRLQTIRIARRDVNDLLRLPDPPSKPPVALSSQNAGMMRPASRSLPKEFCFELANVSVDFTGKRPVLNDVSLAVRHRETIAIIGDSGSGKTTLLQLLTGRVMPTAGVMRYNGDTVQEVPREFINAVSYVPQKGTLFNGTILQNITMFDESLEKVGLQMATMLGLDTSVARMPKGYQTIVGDGAAESLPAGVVQRISIARSLAMTPQVLLFDEANMAIDSAGDALLRDSLEQLKDRYDCTIVLVSWRPSLLRLADRVFRLIDGRLEPLADYRDAFATPVATSAADNQTLVEQHQPESLEAPKQTTWQEFVSRLPHQNSFTRCLRGMLEALHWQGAARQVAEALPHLFGNTQKIAAGTAIAGGGMDITDFCNTLANLQYTHRSESNFLSRIDLRSAPFLFVGRSLEEVMVVLGASPQGGIEIFDGQDGTVKSIPGQLWGRAYFFIPPGQDATRPKSWISMQILRFSSLVWLTMLVTLVGNVMATSSALFNMAIYDSVIPSGSRSMILGLMAGTLVAIALDAGLRFQRARILAYIGAKAERILGAGILERLMAMPAPFTERVAVGVQVARIKSLEVIREMFTGNLAVLYYDAPTTLFFLVVLWVVSPGVILFMILLVASLVLVGAVLVPILRTHTSNSGRLQSQRQAFLTESLANLPVIQGSHAGETWYDRYRELSGKAILANFYVSQLTTILSASAQVLTMAASIGVMAMTAKGVLSGTQSAGSVVAAMMLTWRILAPIQTTFLGISRMVQIFSSLSQVDRLMEIKGERDHHTATNRAELQFKGSVTFSRVSFRYTNDAEPALVGVNCQIPAGSVVAIIGANGSGKSTFIKLLLGLYTPQAGSIQIDDEDIRQLDPIALRQSISYLPQICDIFFGSVAQNLRLVNPVASDEELEEATAKAGLLSEIRAMPNGFDTRLDESRPSSLAAGFKQRLSLARVYLKNSRIALFDEPANNLDGDSEQLFRDAVEELRGSTTIFIVTHRPSHMQMADIVLYLDSGYLRGSGPPNEVKKLLSKNFV
ncbi:peptidase domain-containing ABC transporter [Candidatus Magnetaquicoccus inordinatus]|uniref:peptidase domain-containing ABC transporter n=1 Tax=Candidatus Magnetaquicoccus inordinatus TaxID=2496818 RepID=UPI00187D494E|nr:ATP-binding cassette domain-containing protein [Candidatus Magnetaquicoccus inordinatus]